MLHTQNSILSTVKECMCKHSKKEGITLFPCKIIAEIDIGSHVVYSSMITWK